MAMRWFVTKALAVFAVACCLLPQAGAVLVTPEQASVAARNWLRRGYCFERRMGTDVEAVRSLAGTNGTAFHIAAVRGGGFVVLGSDTEDTPVVAVSAEGCGEPDERSPLWALLRQDLAARARAKAVKRRALQSSGSPSATVASPEERWAKLLNEDEPQDSSPTQRKLLSSANGRASIADVRVDALVQSVWSQTDYGNYGFTSDADICYNYYTPNHWPCGCVATAGAQVMRYHSYPSASVTPGTYACKQGGASVNLTMYGGTYSWDAMTLVPANGCSATSREAIGKLTYDVGVSVGMEYGSGGSRAADYMLAKRFVDRFQYANAVSVVFQYGFFDGGGYPYSLDRFKAAVIPNFDAGLPVVLGISGSGGHAVVGDGYGYSDGDFFVHINLGWADLNGGNIWYMPPNIENYTSIDSVVYNVCPTGASGVSLVSGRILSSEGLAVEGASVRAVAGGITAATATSGAKGIYSLKVSPGDCWIVAEKDGQSGSNRVTLAACVSPHVDESGSYYSDVCPQVGNVCDNDLTLAVAGSPEPLPPEGPEDEMDSAVGSPGLKWTTGEDYPWTVTNDYFLTGESCLRSNGTVTNRYGASSWLKTTVTGPVELGFRYAKTLYSCSFTVECDGEALYRDEEGGSRSDWKMALVNVPLGEHEIVFRFTYKGGRYFSFNGIWLDEVVIDRYSHAPTFYPETTGSEATALTFAGTQQVTISADGGATVYYTTDGSTPDAGSEVYEGPIDLTRTTYLRAIAVAPGKEASPVAEALYRSANPVGPGEWTPDADAVRAAAATNGNLIAVLYANLATCVYCRQLDPLVEGAEFLAWAKANGVYLVTADQSRYPWAKSALGWFSSAHSGTTYWPTIAFFNAWDPDDCIGEGVFRYGEAVNGRTYRSTVASLEECFASFLTERPGMPVERTTYTVTFELGEHSTRTGGGELVQTVEEGGAAVAPTIDVTEGWAFEKWSCDFSAVTSNLTVVAQYQAVQREPLVVYEDIDQAKTAAIRDGKLVFLLSGANWCGYTTKLKQYVVDAGSVFTDNYVYLWHDQDEDAFGIAATSSIPKFWIFQPSDLDLATKSSWDTLALYVCRGCPSQYDSFLRVLEAKAELKPAAGLPLAVAGIGWHEMSFPILPTGGDPADVFAPVEDKVGYVTYGSKNWSPTSGGTLTVLEIGKGYWVQTTADAVSWTVRGQSNPDVEITLKPGWNLIGYPLLGEGEIETVLETALATEKIDFIYSGSRVYPGTLATMTPGKGYWVYANAAVTIKFDFE